MNKTGNFACERRVKFVKEVLKNIGINEQRVQMHQVTAAEANKLAEIIDSVCEQIMEINKMENR